MYFVYVLQSLRDGNKYVGFTTNLEQRLSEHNRGRSFATKSRLPLELIYFEASRNEEDARRREGYLKTTRGRRFLAKRLKVFSRSKL
ncbi:MAG: GIY-YIG nuclease family protein [Candidatus Sungbacteria bacterium]|uniref:GIY-YIG nuclease family protein n=1 Tax=Candidatus Sungiibacteriota bacterium TaxID=2750080 RepID=A0A932YZ67_9BACT|nr:GIY-YIG nuclease family protein [Candidatus Sungbacteria bacterium]